MKRFKICYAIITQSLSKDILTQSLSKEELDFHLLNVLQSGTNHQHCRNGAFKNFIKLKEKHHRWGL